MNSFCVAITELKRQKAQTKADKPRRVKTNKKDSKRSTSKFAQDVYPDEDEEGDDKSGEILLLNIYLFLH